jgi:hypothetical protein
MRRKWDVKGALRARHAALDVVQQRHAVARTPRAAAHRRAPRACRQDQRVRRSVPRAEGRHRAPQRVEPASAQRHCRSRAMSHVRWPRSPRPTLPRSTRWEKWHAVVGRQAWTRVIKLFAAAKARNKNITQDMFDPSAAKAARTEWQKLKGTEAGKLYERVRQHNELSFARHYATMLNNISAMHELPRDAGLDWWGHINKARRLRGRQPAGAARQAERRHQAREAKQGRGCHQGHVPRRLPRGRWRALLGEYDRQRAQPYVHFGRMGDHIHPLRGAPEFYDRCARSSRPTRTRRAGSVATWDRTPATASWTCASRARCSTSTRMKLLKPLPHRARSQARRRRRGAHVASRQTVEIATQDRRRHAAVHPQAAGAHPRSD